MSNATRGSASLVCVLTLLGCGGPKAPSTESAKVAELVLRGGDIVTMNDRAPHATSVAFADGKIVFVGADPSAWIGPRTRVIELAGRTVVPSLTDAHAHLAMLGAYFDQTNLDGCSSPDDCAGRLRPTLGQAPDEWVRGYGWDQNRFADNTFPTHDALDRVASIQPVWLQRVDGHAGWANARALKLAGIGKSSPDPAGGRILRDAAGEPTGILVDNAMELVEKVIPAPTEAERERAILRAQDVALENGLTEVHEMGIDDATVRVYRRLAKSGALRIRVYAFHDPSTLDATLASKPDTPEPFAFFTLRGIKLFADGALGSRGAALLAPYADDPNNRGLLLMPPEKLEATAKRAIGSGWQIAVHAIGDRANRSVLDAFAHAGVKTEHRFRLEHAQVMALGDIERLHSLGVIASMQPTHATSDMPWAEARLGRDRLAGAYALRRVVDSRARTAWGSDFPIESPSPLAGLHAAVTRTDREGKPEGGWLPEQRLSLEEALRGFTVGAAYAAFEESWRGRAAVGQAADITVFDRPLDTRALTKTRVDLTVIGGKVVFERPQ
jgi:predicted amidohydrolase YtcJ